MVTTLPYGSWPSPITAEQIALGGNRIGTPIWVGEQLWWTEEITAEDGRHTIVRATGSDSVATHKSLDSTTVLPAPFNARSRVHEYGGSCWTVLENGGTEGHTPLILFVNFLDQRIHAFREGEQPVPISPAAPANPSAGGPSLRWAEPIPVRLDDVQEVWWVCEQHCEQDDDSGSPRIERFIASVPLDGSAAEDPSMVRRITPTSRFITHARLSPDRCRLAWISWEHPQMPWDGTELHVGTLADGVVIDDVVLDGDSETSVLNPEWHGEDLVFLSDRSGWWNPWTVRPGGKPRQLRTDEQEYAGPLWQLGSSWLTPMEPAGHSGKMLSIHGTAVDQLGVLNLNDGQLTKLDLPHTALAGVALRADGMLAFHGASPTEFPGIHTARLAYEEGQDCGRWHLEGLRTLRSSPEETPRPDMLPIPEPITVTSDEGEQIHAVIYRPRGNGYDAPDGERPPFIAQVHGGPTGQAVVELSLATAYYTSRGIGVVDINYGGSTGFGRAYRDRLKGQWGVVDVADTATVMKHVVAEGIADGDRLGIEGSSAGGWTTLACLTQTDVFAAGVSSFGVADLASLAQDTHDFESHYLDSLVGPYPQMADTYRERAPLNHVDSLNCPVLLLQGDEDLIVPPNQAEMFRDALAAKGIPHAYLLFAGEQHGFRRAENIIASFEASLSFYGQIFGFDTPGVPPLDMSKP